MPPPLVELPTSSPPHSLASLRPRTCSPPYSLAPRPLIIPTPSSLSHATSPLPASCPPPPPNSYQSGRADLLSHIVGSSLFVVAILMDLSVPFFCFDTRLGPLAFNDMSCYTLRRAWPSGPYDVNHQRQYQAMCGNR